MKWNFEKSVLRLLFTRYKIFESNIESIYPPKDLAMIAYEILFGDRKESETDE